MNRKPTKTIKLKKLLINILRHSVLIVFCIIIIFPLLWMFFASFKPEADIFAKDFHLLPTEWRFENYIDAWNAAPFGRFFVNTLMVALIAVVSQVFTCTLAAYAFAKIDFKFKNILFTLLLTTILVPEEATIVPNYLFAQRMHMVNTSLGIALPNLTSVLGIFLLRQIFMQIPNDLIDAARLDGCGIVRVFTKIAIPTSKSTIATIALLAFQGAWNNYMWPYMVTDQNQYRTLQIGLKYLIKPDLGPQWPTIMAASTVILIPIILLFVFLQKYFVAGLVKSGLK